MKKKVIVISLGGSLIIPKDIDVNFLNKFKTIIKKNTKKYKFVINCGGGSIARKYISALRKINADAKLQSMAGISATRMNARFMAYFFSKDPEKGVPHSMKEIKNYLKRQDVVFCGALEYKPKQTSDSTSAQIADYFKTEFINLTNVKGLFDKNPKEFKDAKFIPNTSWEKFNKMANKLKYKPGQHFVLDQTAAKIIMDKKIKTYILGQDIKQLDNLLNSRKFIGTTINN